MRKVTVLSELKNEFSELIGLQWAKTLKFLLKYPKAIFLAMVVLMVSSFLLCFTVLRTDAKSFPQEKKAMKGVEDGLTEIGNVAFKLKKTLETREALKVLLAKDSLDTKDSVLMLRMVEELEKTSGQKIK